MQKVSYRMTSLKFPQKRKWEESRDQHIHVQDLFHIFYCWTALLFFCYFCYFFFSVIFLHRTGLIYIKWVDLMKLTCLCMSHLHERVKNHTQPMKTKNERGTTRREIKQIWEKLKIQEYLTWSKWKSIYLPRKEPPGKENSATTESRGKGAFTLPHSGKEQIDKKFVLREVDLQNLL